MIEYVNTGTCILMWYVAKELSYHYFHFRGHNGDVNLYIYILESWSLLMEYSSVRVCIQWKRFISIDVSFELSVFCGEFYVGEARFTCCSLHTRFPFLSDPFYDASLFLFPPNLLLKKW